MMKTKLRILLLAVSLLFAQTGFALTCKPSDNSAVTVSFAVSTDVAVPRPTPKDTIVWLDQPRTISLYCASSITEGIYAYLTPLTQTADALGSELEVGVRINGTDYLCSKPGCKISLDKKANTYVTFSLTYQLFLARRSAPPGNSNSLLTSAMEHVALQVDGQGGVNYSEGSNYRVKLTGLNKLRYVACDSTLRISPGNINFGTLSSNGGIVGGVIRDLPFSITALKSCNSAYALDANLTAVNGTVQDKTLLIPNDNASVGITILSTDTRQALPYGERFELFPTSTEQTVVRNFLARLTWAALPAKLGSFSAGAAIDIYYR